MARGMSHMFRCRCLLLFLMFGASLVSASLTAWGQQTPNSSVQPLPQGSISGGQGYLWLSQFANPGILGALYQTPTFPYTGLYSLYPGNLLPAMQEEGVRSGPITFHPHLGVAEMYTDNVLRTPTKKGDFFTTLAPGLQAQMPLGSRYLLLADYRSNLQFFHQTPANNVQDQTGTLGARFDLASGIKLDLQGEQKFGHDPRGTALDLQAPELNKWSASSFTGRAQYEGGVIGATLNMQTLRWHYLNNNQAKIRDRISNYVGMTLSAKALPNTSFLLDLNVRQENYDENRNLDNTIYTVSGGVRWDVTGNTSGDLLFGYQHLRFTRVAVDQPGPVLSLFRRDQDSYGNLFMMGRIRWNPVSDLQLTLQPYRTIQQTVVAGTVFFTATGINVSTTYPIRARLDLTANLGFEQDEFSSASGTTTATIARTDTLKNAAVGLNYRAVRWLGVGLQYAFEDRRSNARDFTYQANTIMLSLQGMF